jgi:hypothetical protein
VDFCVFRGQDQTVKKLLLIVVLSATLLTLTMPICAGSATIHAENMDLAPLASGAATQIGVETAPNGSGTGVPAQTLTIGQSLTVYSVARDQFGNYVDAAIGTWSLINKSGGVADTDLVAAPDNLSAVFTARLTGAASIHVSTGGLTSVDSGLITVMSKTNSGGGGSSYPILRIMGFAADAGVSLQRDGVREEAIQLQTGDKKVGLDIAANTKLLDQAGSPLTQLIFSPWVNPPQPPERNTMIMAFELGPEGAAFDPPLTLTVRYGVLPRGVDQSTTRIMYWDGSSWQSLPSRLDVNRTVTAEISHFSKYALVVELFSAQLPQPSTVHAASPGATAAPASAPITASPLPERSSEPSSTWIAISLIALFVAGIVVAEAIGSSRRKSRRP